jgi:hypothetical protein
MTFIAFISNFFLIVWLSYFFWNSQKTFFRKIFLPALFLKLIAGIVLGLIYIYYYTLGDTFTYWHDASQLAHLAKTDFKTYCQFLWNSSDDLTSWNNLQLTDARALFFVKIVSVFNLISFNNYWITTLYFSFISFLGSWFLVKCIDEFLPQKIIAAFAAFLFFPTIVFWSSGLIKESLSMAALFFLSGIFITLWFSGRIKSYQWLLVLLSAWILWSLKYYFAAVFFSVTITSLVYKFLLLKFITPRHYFLEIILWLGILAIPLCVITFLHPNFYPERFFKVIVENYNAYRALSSAEDLVQFKNLSSNGWSIVVNAPWALFSGLFRPMIWEARTFFQVFASIENLLLLLLFTYVLSGIKFISRSPNRILIFACVTYVAALSIFITLSTPNFGTLSRYRVGYLPYFIFLMLSDERLTRILQTAYDRLARYKR